MKTQIKDIELVFSENQQQLIGEIILTIQKNYELILSYLGDNKTIDVSQDVSVFNQTFHDLVTCSFASDSAKQMFHTKNILSTLFIESLIRRKKYFYTTIVQSNPSISDELLSSLIAYKYFEANGTFEDFVEYLKYRNKEEEIFKWLQMVSRWDTYNYLLGRTSAFLRIEDEDFFKKMNNICSIWLNRFVSKQSYKDTPNMDYPKISEKEFDSLFYELLNYINAPVEWTNIYNCLKANNLIVINKDKKNPRNTCFVDKDGVVKIMLSNEDTIRGFYGFAHEFIHYILTQNGALPLKKIAVSEIQSIFFEKITAEFLEKKGYSIEIVNQLINIRESNNYYLFNSMYPLFRDFLRYLNVGKITKKSKISFYKKLMIFINEENKSSLEIAKKDGKNVSKFAKAEIDIETLVDNNCDMMIDAFIKDGYLVINGYQYLLNSYLVEQVLNKRTDDNTIVEKMVNATNNYEIISVKDVLTLFDIEDISKEDAAKEL